MTAALATYCVDISEPKTLRGPLPAYRLRTARWSLADLTTDRRRLGGDLAELVVGESGVLGLEEAGGVLGRQGEGEVAYAGVVGVPGG
ncbi:hypothetical protein [Streptomyces longwoodensis]|uniref:hypothetical protein n=1 Tax=Streptomyces longwoodensis TaxID=68231 RepID=UPI003F53EB84